MKKLMNPPEEGTGSFFIALADNNVLFGFEATKDLKSLSMEPKALEDLQLQAKLLVLLALLNYLFVIFGTSILPELLPHLVVCHLTPRNQMTQMVQTMPIINLWVMTAMMKMMNPSIMALPVVLVTPTIMILKTLPTLLMTSLFLLDGHLIPELPDRLTDNLDHQVAAQANQTCTNKAHLPDTFSSSDPKKLNTFLIQYRLYFQANPTQFQHDNQKADFTITYLTSVMLDWFEVSLTQEEQGVFHDWFNNWSAFVCELCMHFGIDNPKGEAAKMLDTLHMQLGDKIATYKVEFLKHASQLGWNNEVLCHHYYKGLPNCIQDPLSTCEQGKPTTFEEMHHLAIVYDGCYWECDHECVHAHAAEKDPADSLSQKQPNKLSTSNPSNPNLSCSQSQPGNNNSNNNRGNNSNSKNNSNHNQLQALTTKSNTPTLSTSSTQCPTPKFDLSSKLGQNGKLTPEEQKQHLDEDLCLFCSGKGHKVKNCHRKQNWAKICKVKAALPKDSEKSLEK
ncbi:hypothetical protein D9756_011486 [Leucocoprinus leucothites]|uniref:DUF4939 domain-containing protein n=1 Tax=Leucocoprinus leucothites TaxID=201217 RepID=A0A8H5CNU3_9AGAR|nr:hypothetical protein D9756_011486 [Leucoagaricus leucothites]